MTREVAKPDPPPAAPAGSHNTAATCALLWLSGAIADTPPTTDLLMPLLAAYMASPYLPVLFPVHSNLVATVDRIYDEIVRVFPLESRGIRYLRDLQPAALQDLLGDARLIITDCSPSLGPNGDSKPYILVRADGEPPLQFAARDALDDPVLVDRIAECVDLINERAQTLEMDGPLFLNW